jgi:glutathione peroxidase
MSGAHDFSFDKLGGGALPLSQYRGKPVLVVNVASYCGLTPQYAGLQKLHESYGPKGLVVLGVPCNDFGAQEPGTDAEIGTFCQTSYGATFPMTGKVSVIGPDAHPLYRWIGAQLGEDALPKWNFHKFLIGPDGELADAWSSRTAPDDPKVAAAIEAALP